MHAARFRAITQSLERLRRFSSGSSLSRASSCSTACRCDSCELGVNPGHRSGGGFRVPCSVIVLVQRVVQWSLLASRPHPPISNFQSNFFNSITRGLPLGSCIRTLPLARPPCCFRFYFCPGVLLGLVIVRFIRRIKVKLLNKKGH